MEDLVQVVFILIVILASIFDATSRKQRKGRRLPPPEEEDVGGMEASGGREASTAGPPAPGPEPVRAGGQTAERQTADTMVPEDLWAILTGQTPPPRPAPEPTTQRGSEGPPTTWEEAGTRSEAPEKAWEVWEAGEASETLPPEPVSMESTLERSTVPRAVPMRQTTESAPRRTMSSPSAPLQVASVSKRPGAARRGRVRKGARGFDLGSPRELRRAVILREVLGPPVALQSSGDPWER